LIKIIPLSTYLNAIRVHTLDPPVVVIQTQVRYLVRREPIWRQEELRRAVHITPSLNLIFVVGARQRRPVRENLAHKVLILIELVVSPPELDGLYLAWESLDLVFSQFEVLVVIFIADVA
jgi:hypothetical protein